MTVVLDSWALIRYLYDEGPAQRHESPETCSTPIDRS